MRRAFSLVELSIVLVILGLLTGGILAGQSLIRAAELRSINTESSKYIAAVHTFRDKYFALPGDMANATKFWGAAHATPATCKTTASTTAATCDGNGDGKVTYTTGSWEYARFWQHLANAGLLEGSYNGVDTSPTSRFPSSYWVTYWYGQWTGNTTEFTGYWGHDLELYDNANNTNITPAEAWSLDTKGDDGIPNTGKIWSTKGSASYPCTTRYDQATDTGALYNLSYSGNGCWLYYVNAY